MAPHRETAQAPLCQFGRGLRVKSQALALPLYLERSSARKTHETRRCIQVRAAAKRNTLLLCFGVSVDERATKCEPASPPVLGSQSGKESPPSLWARSSFYTSRGYHMHPSLSKLDFSSLYVNGRRFARLPSERPSDGTAHTYLHFCRGQARRGNVAVR